MTTDNTAGWTVHDEGSTAEGTLMPVTAAGTLLGTLMPIWSDVDGVRVEFAPAVALDELSADEARSLGAALCRAADTTPPKV